MSAKRRYALENREAHRAQWRQQAEQRLAKVGGSKSFHVALGLTFRDELKNDFLYFDFQHQIRFVC